jgi:hypothetical protein
MFQRRSLKQGWFFGKFSLKKDPKKMVTIFPKDFFIKNKDFC